MKRRVVAVVILILAVAVEADPLLFEQTEPLNVVLTGPFKSLYKNRKKDIRPYSEGRFAFLDAQGEKITIPVNIKTRGNFRRVNCTNPPLRLNFKKKGNDGTLMAGQDKLKLVAPCKRSGRYEELIALEYLAYQIFERVSEYHFKTRQLDIGYVDSTKQGRPWQTQAFLIEDINVAAARGNQIQKVVKEASRRKLDHGQTALVELFQFFLGNTDYSTLRGPPGDDCCHNMRVVGEEGSDILYPIPYDFDASGFVDAPYSSPAQAYPIKKTTQRYFTGWCKEERFYAQAIAVFSAARSDIKNVVVDAALLSDKTLKKTLKFIDDFYSVIGDDQRVQEQIIARCRGNMIPPPVTLDSEA